jgi:hypothetical protein
MMIIFQMKNNYLYSLFIRVNPFHHNKISFLTQSYADERQHAIFLKGKVDFNKTKLHKYIKYLFKHDRPSSTRFEFHSNSTIKTFNDKLTCLTHSTTSR